jgi:hypothetical protein
LKGIEVESRERARVELEERTVNRGVGRDVLYAVCAGSRLKGTLARGADAKALENGQTLMAGDL